MKRFIVIALIALMVLGLIACGGNNASLDASGDERANHSENSANSAAGGNEEQNEAASVADQGDKATQYPLTVKDATGVEVTFAKAPERIVSASPSGDGGRASACDLG